MFNVKKIAPRSSRENIVSNKKHKRRTQLQSYCCVVLKLVFSPPTLLLSDVINSFVLDSINSVSHKYFKIELIDRRLSSVCYSAWIFENSSEDYYGK